MVPGLRRIVQWLRLIRVPRDKTLPMWARPVLTT
jgi:hypothetical protein